MKKVLKRKKKNSPLDQRNNETDYLLSTKANSKRLSSSIKQANLGKVFTIGKKILLPKKVSGENFKLLSNHQTKIAFMICKEKTVGEIAQILNISESTFFNTRINIFKKLGVKSTVGLVKYVYKYGYLKF
jgi:DNA-binding CsgD family transcriptional regulator